MSRKPAPPAPVRREPLLSEILVRLRTLEAQVGDLKVFQEEMMGSAAEVGQQLEAIRSEFPEGTFE